jgi:hypothetical protein
MGRCCGTLNRVRAVAALGSGSAPHPTLDHHRMTPSDGGGDAQEAQATGRPEGVDQGPDHHRPDRHRCTADCPDLALKTAAPSQCQWEGAAVVSTIPRGASYRRRFGAASVQVQRSLWSIRQGHCPPRWTQRSGGPCPRAQPASVFPIPAIRSTRPGGRAGRGPGPGGRARPGRSRR